MALKNKEIASMKPEDMQTKLDELRKELMKENTQLATGTAAKSPGQVRMIKKTIARLMTAMHTKNKDKKKSSKSDKEA